MSWISNYDLLVIQVHSQRLTQKANTSRQKATQKMQHPNIDTTELTLLLNGGTKTETSEKETEGRQPKRRAAETNVDLTHTKVNSMTQHLKNDMERLAVKSHDDMEKLARHSHETITETLQTALTQMASDSNMCFYNVEVQGKPKQKQTYLKQYKQRPPHLKTTAATHQE